MNTLEGEFGVDIPFRNGLNIIRADNSMGKSTCFQAILYALGLDAMLTSRQSRLPLPPVLTTKIFPDESESFAIPVQSAQLWLEIEANHKVLTLSRSVSSGPDSHLVKIYDSPMDVTSNSIARPMYVRTSGAATEEHGLHRWLANEVLQWTLPQVEHNDGRRSPLYLETIFPLFVVEQRFGWSKIQGNMPYIFGIRDVAKRATEFVLGLSTSESLLKRSALDVQLGVVQGRYGAAARSLRNIASIAGANVEGVGESLPSELPQVEVTVVNDNRWYEIETRQLLIKNELADLQIQLHRRRKNGTSDLNETQIRQKQLTKLITERRQDLKNEERERASLTKRINNLQEELRKLKDLRTLAKAGADTRWELFESRCPTCWQLVADATSPDAVNVLSIVDTFSFVQSEIKLLEGAIADATRREGALRSQISQLDSQLETINIAISSEDLDPDEESRIGNLSKLLELRQELARLQRLSSQISVFVDEARETVREGQELRAARALINTGLSDRDKEKLKALEENFRLQEREYGFKSFAIDELSISNETYKPSVDGFELSFEASASDGIRTVWSYLLSLLEISVSYKEMNHIGALLFDEPRQQSASEMSFGQLLRRAAVSAKFGQQVIFFTSEKVDVMRRQLGDSNYNLENYRGRMLQRLG